MAKPAFYTCIASLVTTIDGHEVEYHAGEVVEADDPAISKRPTHFAPLVVRESHNRSTVEQATAAPGEQRGKAMTNASLKGR